jgi:hypothetical protein
MDKTFHKQHQIIAIISKAKGSNQSDTRLFRTIAHFISNFNNERISLQKRNKNGCTADEDFINRLAC